MSVTVEITGLSYGGSGVGRMGAAPGKVVFVPGTAPGDVARVSVEREKKSHAFGVMEELITASPARVEPRCPVFGLCGGCQWLHIDYDTQMEWKRRIYADSLRRIGRVEPPPVDAPLPRGRDLGYRTRARFHAKGALVGFYGARSRDIVDIDSCPLLEGSVNEAYLYLKRALADRLATPFELEVAVSPMDGMATALVTMEEGCGGADVDWRSLICGGPVKGIEVRVGPLRGAGGRFRPIVRIGDRRIRYSAAGFEYAAELGVFTQANLFENERLVERVVDIAAPGPQERVWDLFCGVGNLTLALARRAGLVAGIEDEPGAVWYARENAERNAALNIRFSSGAAALKVRDEGAKFLASSTLDMVILDPPREGDAQAVEAIAELGVPRIIYVSCSPPTLARDIGVLVRAGYVPKRGALVDLFPQTYHIESITELVRG